MGLDTYAARSEGEGLTEPDLAAFDHAGIELCGGLFSGGGGSFRGKVYSRVVRDITGVSLYQEWIPAEIVKGMASAFARCDPQRIAEREQHRAHATSSREIAELGRFFAVCAKRGLGLRGWW